jgi:iron-sulfur cluster assembly protein
MSISLTERAAEHIRRHLESQAGSVGLRIGVKRTGCSGLAYVVNIADEVAANDVVFDSAGVRLVVDSEALAFIDGTEVDYVRNGLNEAFSFKNPNAAGECGCGESFNV